MRKIWSFMHTHTQTITHTHRVAREHGLVEEHAFFARDLPLGSELLHRACGLVKELLAVRLERDEVAGDVVVYTLQEKGGEGLGLGLNNKKNNKKKNRCEHY
jgi:hypothetical protein